jgi:hypothetical protein
MDIDGEYFVHKTRDAEGEPRIQLIEFHRIGDEFGSKETLEGVGLDAWGAPVFYRVLEDNNKARDLPAETHAEWAGKLVALLGGKVAIQAALDSETFVLHDLLDRESVTSPDEARGRESVLSYEAVVSAI